MKGEHTAEHEAFKGWIISGDIIPILVDGLRFLITMLEWLEYRE